MQAARYKRDIDAIWCRREQVGYSEHNSYQSQRTPTSLSAVGH